MKRSAWPLVALIGALLAGCAPAPPASQTVPAPSSIPSRTLTVFASSSLTDPFLEIGKDFEAEHPAVNVSLDFAGSTGLRTQLLRGAVADVYASSDLANMDALIAERLVPAGNPQVFATNVLVVVVPAKNPGRIQSLSDLAKPGLKVDLLDPAMPEGGYFRQVLANMSQDPTYGASYGPKVLANASSTDTDVKQVVARVKQGEVDAGIVFTTDAMSAQGLTTLSIPRNFNVTAQYPIAALAKAPNPDLAQAFVAYVLSSNGQAVMKKWGFAPGIS